MIYPTSLCPEAGGRPWSQPQSLRLEWLRVVAWTCAGPGGRALPPQAPSAASIVNNAHGQHQNAHCPVREGCGCCTGPLGSR